MKNRQKVLLGIRSMRNKKWKMIFPVAYLTIFSLLWWFVKELILKFRFIILAKLCLIIFTCGMVGICVIGMRRILICLGSPKSARKIEKKLERIKLVDCTGNTPILSNVMEKDGVLVYEFFSLTIPKEKYEKCQGELATTLNMQIISVEQGRDNQYVLVKCVSATNKLPDIIEWDDSDLSKKDFELLLGESQFGKESIDINATPHLLIGGSSGSGKSKLLKLLLYQCVKKGAEIKLFDFKGGVDYPDVWHEKCNIITTPEAMKEELDKILSIMEERRKLLVKEKCSNIHEYNKKVAKKENRIIISCDEVADVLDKTGCDKEQKTLISQIESQLSKIARQGRAFGIHLFFATQRPDSEILKGQIKNNIGYRICGRADKVLSQIILDNSEGADKISQDAQGLFLTNMNSLFKAYFVQENCLEEGLDVS